MKQIVNKMKIEIANCEAIADKTNDDNIQRDCKAIAVTLGQLIEQIELQTKEKHCNFYVDAINMMDSLDFNKYDYEINVMGVEK